MHEHLPATLQRMVGVPSGSWSGTGRAAALGVATLLLAAIALAGTAAPAHGPEAPTAFYEYHDDGDHSYPWDGCATWAEGQIVVPDSFEVGNLHVGVWLWDELREYVHVRLTAPDGTMVSLFEGGFGEGYNINALFDDDAPNPTAIGNHAWPPPYYYVTWHPTQPLAAFNGKQAAGTWRLRACSDTDFFPEAGSIYRWSLFFESGGATLSASATGVGVCPGSTAQHTFSLENQTGADLTMQLAYSSTWPVDGPASIGPIPDGATASFAAQVRVPESALALAAQAMTVTATGPGRIRQSAVTTQAHILGPFQTETSVPGSRLAYRPSLVLLDNTLYKLGGGTTSPGSRQLDIYDLSSRLWRLGADLPEGRDGIHCEALAGAVYCAPGYQGGVPTRWVYTPTSDSWVATALYGYPDITGYGATTNWSAYWLLGGRARDTGFCSAATFSSSPGSSSWGTGPSLPITLCPAATETIGGLIYAVAGEAGTTTPAGTGATYRLSSTWSTRAPMPVTSWAGAASAAIADRYLVMAGGGPWDATAWHGSPSRQGFVYDTVGNSWSSLPTMLARPLLGASGVSSGASMWLTGGVESTSGTPAVVPHVLRADLCAHPVAADDLFATAPATALVVPPPGVLANDGDLLGHAITAIEGDPPGHGTLSLASNGSFTYTPTAGFEGSDGFTYAANDGTRDSAPATVTIAVRPVLHGSGLRVDADNQAGSLSNLNSVLEPGETVTVSPTWTNDQAAPATLTATAGAFTGPAGVAYTVVDGAAGYGIVAAGASANAFTATGDAYLLAVGNPSNRPALHWDASFTETPSSGTSRPWMLHVGNSFVDVSPSYAFYPEVETLLHAGVTQGCDIAGFCPSGQVSRAQIAMFIARALSGSDSGVPAAGTVPGRGSYSCGSGGPSIFADIPPTAQYCRHTHLLAARGITLGCTGTQYCPAPSVLRSTMAMLVARAAAGSDEQVPLTYADFSTGRAYSCDVASPVLHFSDVGTSDQWCRHTHYLWARGTIDGCTASAFCPASPVSRGQMARFLVNAFALELYAP